tara:strand:+ start:1699 stop:2880 length:1182 start_codon:yes stop_codon:yes gene_type:complete
MTTATAQKLLYALKTLGATQSVSLASNNLEFSLSQGQFMAIFELFENPQTTDAQVFSFFKTLTDSSTAADAAAISFATARAETTTTVDEQILAVFKSLVDATSITDAHVKTFGLGRADTANAVDSQITHLNKHAADTVNATDDVDGAASVLDDQEMQFVKARSDTAAATESLSKQVGYNRTHTNAFSAVDLASLSPEKFFSDVGTVADDVNFVATSKVVSDTPRVTDNAVRQTTRPLTDNAVVSDAHAVTQSKTISNATSVSDNLLLARSKGLTDTGHAAENNIFSVGKGLSNSAEATDLFTSQRTFSRSFTDTAYATDDIDGAASVLDDQEVQFVKARSDIASVSDSIIVLKTIPLFLTETPSFADAGSLISQGYCDLSYFASDYVGATRTF